MMEGLGAGSVEHEIGPALARSRSSRSSAPRQRLPCGNREGWIASTLTIAVALGSGSGLALLAAFAAIADWRSRRSPHDVRQPVFTWIPAGLGKLADGLLGEPLDRLRAAGSTPLGGHAVFVTFVGFLIHVYSVGYMHGETRRAYARYFAYLNLFMFAMLLLVLGANFVGAVRRLGRRRPLLLPADRLLLREGLVRRRRRQEGVHRQPHRRLRLPARRSSSLFNAFGTARLHRGLRRSAGAPTRARLRRPIATAIAPAASSSARCGKSAQLPLYVWLPDAMAGPTPVSALIHAATMVTAGVYMVARSQRPLRARRPTRACWWSPSSAALTAIFAATIGLAQNDIKKVLAYSTVSQLGYMFLGGGRRRLRGGDLPRLHPRLLQGLPVPRLRLGDPRHARGEQDMRKMGGLREAHADRPTGRSWSRPLAIAGIPPLAGFFSKDEILGKALRARDAGDPTASARSLVLWGSAARGVLHRVLHVPPGAT